MKNTILFLSLVLFNLAFEASAQSRLRSVERQQAIAAYKKMEDPEISLKRYLEIEGRIQAERKNASSSSSVPDVIDPTGCSNGDFESGLVDPAYWQGSYGSVIIGQHAEAGQLDQSTFVSGLPGGRFSIVSSGTSDPIISSLSTVAPTPANNNFAVRIGNSNTGGEAEMLTKTFKVTEENYIVSFDYAVVMQDPSHTELQNPSFMLKVFDKAAESYVTGLVDLDGQGGDALVADTNNPFFASQGQVVYTKNWQCATVNLYPLIGKIVRLEFITKDCSRTAHFGYAYLDNLCAGCGGAENFMVLAEEESSSCGLPADFCFDYAIPENGTIQIEVDIIQDGGLINQLQSPVLASGDRYCFELLGNDLIGNTIDLNATAHFTVPGHDGQSIDLPKQFAGLQGYPLSCNNEIYPFDPCCPPLNRESMVTLFDHLTTGSIADPYMLSFNNDPSFQYQMQSYLDFLHAVNPSITHLYFTWRLMEMTDPDNLDVPLANYFGNGQLGSDVFNHFEEGGSGLQNNLNFFMDDTQELEINKWYKVHVGMYLNDGIAFFDSSCSNDTYFYYRVQLMNNGRLQRTVTDGKKTIDQSDISDFIQNRSN